MSLHADNQLLKVALAQLDRRDNKTATVALRIREQNLGPLKLGHRTCRRLSHLERGTLKWG